MTSDDIRYPIGKFQYDPSTNSTLRAEQIEQIAALPRQLNAAAAGLSEEQLDTSYRDGGWTVRQVIHHLADSHLNAYVRFKLALTEDRPTIKPYEEAKWAELKEVFTTPASASLALLEPLHIRWSTMLRGMTDADFALEVIHPEQNRPMSLDRLTALYAWHGRHHTAHITRLRERRGWV